MEKPVKISAVSYLNTKPFLYGIFQEGLNDFVDISLDMPSDCARKLIEGEVDLGLVPVASIPMIQSPFIVSDYCIGTQGAVKTVGIFSECPIENISELYLDYQSKTSVALCQYLCREYWKINPVFIDSKIGYENKISGNAAALIIGDRTIGLDNKYPFVYDLGETWNSFTGMPFVFATWVSNGKLPESFLNKFNNALRRGVENRHVVAREYQSSYPDFNVQDYYDKYIDFDLTPDKKEALNLFLSYIEPKTEVVSG